jgi:hypothetical protein
MDGSLQGAIEARNKKPTRTVGFRSIAGDQNGCAQQINVNSVITPSYPNDFGATTNEHVNK